MIRRFRNWRAENSPPVHWNCIKFERCRFRTKFWGLKWGTPHGIGIRYQWLGLCVNVYCQYE